jgi:hypothetical protein
MRYIDTCDEYVEFQEVLFRFDDDDHTMLVMTLTIHLPEDGQASAYYRITRMSHTADTVEIGGAQMLDPRAAIFLAARKDP